MIMNASIVNFVIDHTTKILKDPKFLGDSNFSLEMVIRDQSRKILSGRTCDRLNGSFHEYIISRKRSTESQNRNGNIRGNEDKISNPISISWMKEKVAQSQPVGSFDDDSLGLNQRQRELRDQYFESLFRLDHDVTVGRVTTSDAAEMRASMMRQYIRQNSEARTITTV